MPRADDGDNDDVNVLRFELRARQVKALYQRELTALHRASQLDEAARLTQARRLWEQAVEQLTALADQAEAQAGVLTDEQRALFAPPALPAELVAVTSEK